MQTRLSTLGREVSHDIVREATRLGCPRLLDLARENHARWVAMDLAVELAGAKLRSGATEEEVKAMKQARHRGHQQGYERRVKQATNVVPLRRKA